ncbi:MAG: hypothetical protein A6F71_06820 [Cycloclasticus sp. symbiont of Poecilosclerida sp. M]|nr:MAG: hypothetical protein A6F71_06820 [Cycloclasticus sp. symbiont of Poecilosclerida sp. M]
MKNTFRKISQPILSIFESGEEAYSYKESHRKILLVMGGLFLFLSAVSAMSAIVSSQIGGVIPFLVFFLLGFVCEIVGLLGNNRAVAKMWGSK